MSEPAGDAHDRGLSCLQRLRERGVLRVALSYTVIAWLLLQIADVVFDPLGVPKWAMTALIGAALAGFPLAVAMAWFLEIGERGIEVDRSAAGVARPTARGLRHYADAVVIGVLLVAVAILAVRQSDLGRPNPPANPAIAVLPFENLSGDPEQEYFSDGLAEEMLDRLGRVPGLRVIARASSFSFKGKGVDAKTIAEKLGVTTVLEGSVRRDGQRLRLKARLIDGATGQQAWSGSFDRELTDVFKLQDELANAVVEAIVPAARGEASAEPQAPTSDLNAYDYYLLARTQLALRLPETIRKSVELAQQAVERDPKFARAYAQLASSLIFLQMLDRTADPDESQADLRRAEAAIHQALALDPKLSEAYGALANLQRETGRPGAEDSYKHAIDLNPNNAAAWHDYSVYLSNFANRPEESIRATARSLELDPRQPVTWANYLDHVAHEGRARFEAELTRAIRSVGDMPGAVARFGLMIWAHDADSYRREFAGLVRRFADTPGALDGQVFPVAVICGFPVEIMLAAEAKARKPQDGIAPLWALEYRAWQPVDPGLAATRLPAEARGVLGLAYPKIRLFLEADAAGLEGDWKRLDGIFQLLLDGAGEESAHVRSIMAFWLAVQGRYEEAARSLALAEPIEASRNPFVLGGDTHWGLMDTAKARILSATGRREEARRLVSEQLGHWRSERRAARAECRYNDDLRTPVRYASLAADAGLKAEAVEALGEAMRCGDLPFGFWPQLPWFRSLEGYAPYDELVRERARRVQRIRQELLQMEAGATGTVATIPGAPLPWPEAGR